MTRPQRYTGPELSALLREVRTELGEQATIHEANRIRTGGIAGFFRSEAFEVLASPPNGTGNRDGVSAPLETDPFEGTVFAENRAFAETGASRSMAPSVMARKPPAGSSRTATETTW